MMKSYATAAAEVLDGFIYTVIVRWNMEREIALAIDPSTSNDYESALITRRCDEHSGIYSMPARYEEKFAAVCDQLYRRARKTFLDKLTPEQRTELDASLATIEQHATLSQLPTKRATPKHKI
ncbi:hypothetical protein PMO31116_00517 [Pandoraea morbifera]|uniref:Uncharacterized protein n=2 Tax=Pandoraea morbifera TaxID=2508300 RepID=A0A5E4S596_9BURK|nr:hypothetical protein PMO31116_00517 [Pandoraea morbifera]